MKTWSGAQFPVWKSRYATIKLLELRWIGGVWIGHYAPIFGANIRSLLQLFVAGGRCGAIEYTILPVRPSCPPTRPIVHDASPLSVATVARPGHSRRGH